MKERPIIFSSPMIRAILEGRKTQTRRIIKPQPDRNGLWPRGSAPGASSYDCPCGQSGDRLWVREAFVSMNGYVFYRADALPGREHIMKYQSPIHMPRWASRITLEITKIRVERVQDISEADAIAEGCEQPSGVPTGPHFMRQVFRGVWDSIHGPCSWGENPWVWVLEFKRIA